MLQDAVGVRVGMEVKDGTGVGGFVGEHVLVGVGGRVRVGVYVAVCALVEVLVLVDVTVAGYVCCEVLLRVPDIVELGGFVHVLDEVVLELGEPVRSRVGVQVLEEGTVNTCDEVGVELLVFTRVPETLFVQVLVWVGISVLDAVVVISPVRVKICVEVGEHVWNAVTVEMLLWDQVPDAVVLGIPV